MVDTDRLAPRRSGARSRQVTYYLLEKCGDTRQVFGPYANFAAAQNQCGNRYIVVSGDSLENGLSFRRGPLVDLIRVGSIRIEDGSSIDGL